METEVLHKKKMLAPKLRFKGFDTEWVQTKLGDVGKVRMCKRIFSYETTELGDVPFYKIGTFGKEADAYITKELYLNYKERFSFPKVGDILMSASGTLGRTVVYDGSPAYFQDSNIVWIDNEEELITNSFLYYIYQLVRYDSEGGTIQRLYNSIISKAKFCKPSLTEQQKIASFLSAVDEKIQQLTRKKELLELYKKGVMQQLFSGKLRFKDEKGKAFPKWEEKMFYDLLTEVLDFRGRTPLKIGMDWGGDILSLSANNVKDGYIDLNAECNMASEELYEKWMGKVNLEKGDIVFTMEAPLGKALLVPDNKKYILSQRVVAFKTIKEVSNDFLIQLIWGAQFQGTIERLSTGSTAKGINQKSFKKVKITIPCLEEQKKIANYLSNIDSKIESVTNQITQTQTFKKGLLQQLFV